MVEAKREIPAAASEPWDALLLEERRGEWCVVEDVLVRRAWLIGIFADEEAARAGWSRLAAAARANPETADVAGGEGPAIRVLADTDWRDSYKAHFRAWTCGRLHWVPVWEKETHALPPGHAALWLDPGLAFGTGNHETTRLCCERLVQWAERGVPRALSDAASPRRLGGRGTRLRQGFGGLAARSAGASEDGSRRVIDAGCGSGILALSAALLGCGPIEAFDLDPEAVRVSRENAAMNGLADSVEFFVAGLEEGLANSSADLVLANIQADVLGANARFLLGAVADGGTLVLSGILAAELAQVRNAFAQAAPGWQIASRVLGEWSDLCFTAPSSS